MANYVPPIGEITLKFDLYTPPTGEITLVFGDTADLRISSVSLFMGAYVQPSLIDYTFTIQSSPCEIGCYVPVSSIECSEGLASKHIVVGASVGISQIEYCELIDSISPIVGVSLQESQIDYVFFVQSDDLIVEVTPSTSNIELYDAVDSNNISVQCSFSCVDADGYVVDSFRITEIPEIHCNAIDIGANLSSFSIEGGQHQDLPARTSSGVGCRWQKAKPVPPDSTNARWEEGTKIYKRVSSPHKLGERADIIDNIMWKGKQVYCDDNTLTEWSNATTKDGYLAHLKAKGIMTYADDFTNTIWNFSLNPCDDFVSVDYLVPPAKDSFKSMAFDEPIGINTFKTAKYNIPDPVDRHHTTFWGLYWYLLLCRKYYYPPRRHTDTVLNFGGESIDGYTEEERLTFDITRHQNQRCPYDHPYSGSVDSPVIIIVIPPQGYPTDMPIRGYYYMQNTTFIKRISGQMEDIDFQSVTVSIDQDSWAWSFDITLLSEDSLNLIKPVRDVYTDVEININGWKWTCRIEQWREQRSFGRRSWSVTGRSPSIMLAEPYAPLQTFINADSIHGGQYIDALLTSEGWATTYLPSEYLNPNTTWLIPANTINLVDSSVLKAVQSLASAVGYSISTTPNTVVSRGGSQTLILSPRYPTTPWRFSDDHVSHIITDDMCHSLGRSNKISSPVDSIIVSGDTNGVVVKATRHLHSGESPAPMVTDPYITSREAGLERAKTELSSRGYWLSHSLNLFSLYSPESGSTGVIMPGKVVKMMEGNTSWLGINRSTSITSSWSDKGLTTSQAIEVEQYNGN